MLQKRKGKIKRWGRELRRRRIAYHERNWKDTYQPVYLTAVFLFALLFGVGGAQLFHYRILAFLLGAVTGFLAANLLLLIFNAIISVCMKYGVKNFICCFLILSVAVLLCVGGTLGNSAVWSAVFGLIFGIALIIFGKSLWAFFHNKAHTWAVVITGFISGLCCLSGCIILGGDGFKDDYTPEYLSLAREAEQAVGFESELKHGRYTAQCVEYGSKEGLKSKTVDLSYAVSNADGIEGIWRGLVSDYDVSKAPVAGKIWYPKELTECPVLFFVHGNHNILTASYLGYDYLGEYLATHGYVFVSVDENVLNGLSGENDARAILLLENIKNVLAYNGDKGCVLAGKIDEDEIAVAGHSRGGEAAATACLFNDYKRYPENGKYKFNYHFTIRSVIAVAPTVDQYMPMDHQVELRDVNYLLLHGANDQDVNVFMGNIQYENVEFSGKEEYIKTSLYISNANHGQFNSLWGKYDVPSPIAQLLNTKNFIAMEEQQTILKVFTKTFLDKTLKGMNQYETLLTDYRRYNSYLPKTLYIQQYEKSGSRMLCNYEEDSDLLTGTDQDVRLMAWNMRCWTEEMMCFSNESDEGERKNYTLRLVWGGTDKASYDIEFQSPVSIKNSSIAFDICDMDEAAVEKKEYKALEPILCIRDTGGNQAQVSVSDYATVYPALPVRLGKMQYLADESEYKHQYQTVSIPAVSFDDLGGALDLDKIDKIEILFSDRKTGNISIDNICIQMGKE